MMRRPQCRWVQEKSDVESYVLTCVNSTYQMGRVVQSKPKKGVDERWRAYSYLVEGVHWCETREQAQNWLLGVISKTFADLREHAE